MDAYTTTSVQEKRMLKPMETEQYPKGRCLEEILGHIGDQQRELGELSEHICNRLFGIRKADAKEGNMESVAQVMEGFVESNQLVLDMLREAMSRL